MKQAVRLYFMTTALLMLVVLPVSAQVYRGRVAAQESGAPSVYRSGGRGLPVGERAVEGSGGAPFPYLGPFDDGYRKDTAEEVIHEAAGRDVEISGEVVEVSGADVRIRLSSGGAPREGWDADLFYVTTQGRELFVGTWKIIAVEGQECLARAGAGGRPARKGWKAVIRPKKHDHIFQETAHGGPADSPKDTALESSGGLFGRSGVDLQNLSFDQFLKSLETDSPTGESQRTLPSVKSDADSGGVESTMK